MSKLTNYTIKILGLCPKGVKDSGLNVDAFHCALTKLDSRSLSLKRQVFRRLGSLMHKRFPLVLALILFSQSFFLVAAQKPAQSPAASGEQRKTSEPYTGDLSIFESPGRDERLQINRVMEILGIAPGTTVADIGAGSGWFTVRAAKRVGEAGVVYAVDINPEAIQYIGERAQKERLANVKTILSKVDDALLPAGAVDVVLLLKTYHEVAQPVVLLRNLRASLRPGAKVAIIDRNGNGENHGVARDVVIREAAQAGYKLLEQYDFVKGDKMDYFLVLVPKE
jgi:SAM-dependent methyltransferase